MSTVPPPFPTQVPAMSPEELAARKAAEAAAKAAEAAARKAAKEAEMKERAAQRAAEKAARDAARAQDREAKAAAKNAAKLESEAAKMANKMPRQNGVTRPKPDTICGRNWATYDEISIKNGAPCSIKEALEVLRARGVNDSTIKTQYAHWRKFNGVVGRVEAPKPPIDHPPPTPVEAALVEPPAPEGQTA